MRPPLLPVLAILTLCSPGPAQDPDPARTILQDLEEVEDPAKRAQLILQLYQQDPAHAALAELMPERWSILAGRPGGVESALQETGEILESEEAAALVIHAAFFRAQIIGQVHDFEPAEFLPAYERFQEEAGADPRGLRLLSAAARAHRRNQENLLLYYRRIVADYPEAEEAEVIPGKIRQIEGLGKPFELEFEDAITGESVSLNDYAGKIVILDFWATWCQPCIRKMPELLGVVEKYQDRGVAIIGISLDESVEKGGLDKLRSFVRERELDWPQYYLGGGWESEFSRAWGVDALPAAFLIDRDGKLYSTKANFRLEETLLELLARDEGGSSKGKGR
ncbi:MAG: TlpA disulfide reductase family protein [Planctomycetota bacterium]|jgi:thiol-disulfide isomerase/thioredoxin